MHVANQSNLIISVQAVMRLKAKTQAPSWRSRRLHACSYDDARLRTWVSAGSASAFSASVAGSLGSSAAAAAA